MRFEIIELLTKEIIEDFSLLKKNANLLKKEVIVYDRHNKDEIEIVDIVGTLLTADDLTYSNEKNKRMYVTDLCEALLFMCKKVR